MNCFSIRTRFSRMTSNTWIHLPNHHGSGSNNGQSILHGTVGSLISSHQFVTYYICSGKNFTYIA